VEDLSRHQQLRRAGAKELSTVECLTIEIGLHEVTSRSHLVSRRLCSGILARALRRPRVRVGQRHDLSAVQLDSGQVRLLESDVGEATVSPDGQLVARRCRKPECGPYGWLVGPVGRPNVARMLTIAQTSADVKGYAEDLKAAGGVLPNFPRRTHVLARSDNRAAIRLSGEHQHGWVREGRNAFLYPELAGSTRPADSTECSRGARNGSRHRQFGLGGTGTMAEACPKRRTLRIQRRRLAG
jgi:hypothetical protein